MSGTTPMNLSMIFLEFSRDNCRAYYRQDGRLYCIQDETTFSRPSFSFYRCSSDGEPSHAIPSPFQDLQVEYLLREIEHLNRKEPG